MIDLKRCFSFVLAGGVAVLLASASDAASTSTIFLSELSSEESGSACEPSCTNIPTADDLDAELEFSVVDNGSDLDITLTLTNNTDQAPAGTFSINQVYFNLSDAFVGLTVVNTSSWSMYLDGCAVGGSTGDPGCTDLAGMDTKADGFGIYDVAFKTSGGGAIDATESIALTFTILGGAGIGAEAFTTALSRDTEIGGAIFGVVAAKFIDGPQVLCPGGEIICDSGFGATTTPIPEPTTASLMLLGLIGLAVSGRKRGVSR